MTTTDKIEKLKTFSNEKEFREFLIDFLKKRGFLDVIHTHRYGSPELGKDIIAKFPHGLDGFEWYSFVVKKGRIGGGTTEVEEIKGQIKQSFEYPYKGIDGNRLKINKVIIVTNENFTTGAQDSISRSPELNIYNNYKFWWNETLIPEIDTHYSDFWLPGDSFSKEYSRSFKKKLDQ
jgi:HJR/Mrr/RecB family endonuclease